MTGFMVEVQFDLRACLGWKAPSFSLRLDLAGTSESLNCDTLEKMPRGDIKMALQWWSRSLFSGYTGCTVTSSED